LFVKICDAVNAAHLRGVIHRDLKPSNILIDDNGEPHILDFGVAKTVTGETTSGAGREVTTTGQFIGSLPWASPEQTEGVSAKIDMRTDVYSLGVILYQMLTGRFPYPVSGNAHAVLENILRSEPTRPSAIFRSLNRELDTIVLKCLQKAPLHRYQSAGELAADIRRHLNDEPIMARPVSSLYQLRKFAKRNKAMLGGVVGIFVVLVLGVVGTSIGLVRARAEAQRTKLVSDYLQELFESADPAKAQGEVATILELADQAAQEIDTRFANEPLVAGRLRDTIGWLYHQYGRKQDAEEQLRTALAELRPLLDPDDPDLLWIENRYAIALAVLGRLDESETLSRRVIATFERISGPESADVARAMTVLGAVSYRRRAYEAAAEVYRRQIEILRKLPDASSANLDHPMRDLAKMLMHLGELEEADRLSQEALEIREGLSGPNNFLTMGAYVVRAEVLNATGRPDEAIDLFRRSVEISRAVNGPTHWFTLNNTPWLSKWLADAGRHEEALELMRETLDACRLERGADDEETLRIASETASILRVASHLDEAERLARDTIERTTRVLGSEHRATLEAQRQLGMVLMSHESYAEAESVFRTLAEAADRLEGFSFPVHPRLHVGSALAAQGQLEEAESEIRAAQDPSGSHARALVNVLLSQEKFNEAVAVAEEALATRGETPGYPYRSNFETWRLADCYRLAGRYEEAVALTREALALCEQNDDQGTQLAVIPVLGAALTATGELQEAERLFLRGLELADGAAVARDWPLGRAHYGICLARMGRFEGAEEMLLAGYEQLHHRDGDHRVHTQEAITGLAELYRAWGKPERAAEWRAMLETRSDPDRTELTREAEVP
jgi:tetratricopeptide (TPR) repeat protein